ncbi:MAG: nucleotidyltransferase family protein [Rhodospirillales bacterium]|nr:nucleotidyltransferase family protein [Rhodospirillales bacterium]
MKDWRSALLAEGGTVADAVRVLEANVAHICLVVDEHGRLKGTVTDGDVRRGLLRSVPLGASVAEVMKKTPLTGRPEESRQVHLEAMIRISVRQLPLVDREGRVVGLVTSDEIARPGPRPNRVVLMAGGLGLRLRPLTEETPKPMLRIGTKPLLETTLESFLQQDFRRFYISVNYRADKVKAHFGDGSRFGCEIRYLEEKEQLGTAGALGLLAEGPAEPLIVMNGDVLTKVNFGHLLDFHREHDAAATMCVREYDFQVPYGVVRLEGARIDGLVEKPIHSFFVNAGIYVVEPRLLDSVPRGGQPFHMTELFERAIARKHRTAAFPIREYWIDIGQLDDFARANGEWDQMPK